MTATHGPAPLLFQQPRDRGELLLPAHDVRRHHPRTPKDADPRIVPHSAPLLHHAAGRNVWDAL
jgi:hypothetical protein